MQVGILAVTIMLMMVAVIAPSSLAAEMSAQGADREVTVPADRSGEAKGLLKLGSSLSERGDYTSAEIAFRQILASADYNQEDQKEALVGMGKMYHRAGNLAKAAAFYEKFLKEFPDDIRAPDVLLDLGRVLRSLGAYRLAINRFYSVIDSTLKLQAESFDHYELLAKTAQFEIAETYFTSGNYTEAEKFFSRLRLLELAPVDRARAQFKSAYALQMKGDFAGSVLGLRSFLQQWPQDENVPEARSLLANALLRLKRPDESLAVMLALLRGEAGNSGADPKRWAYWQRLTGNQLGNEFFKEGDSNDALIVYQGLLPLSSDPAWRLPVSYQMGLCYEHLGMAERARTIYQTIIETGSMQPEKSLLGAPPQATDISDVVEMATWRLKHITWDDQMAQRVTAFFSTKALTRIANLTALTAK